MLGITHRDGIVVRNILAKGCCLDGYLYLFIEIQTLWIWKKVQFLKFHFLAKNATKIDFSVKNDTKLIQKLRFVDTPLGKYFSMKIRSCLNMALPWQNEIPTR